MKLSLIIIFNFLFLFAGAKGENIPASIYDFQVKAMNGNTIDFAQFKGKKILIVNTPEIADYAREYAELEKLYQKYQGKLVIIGFITDDFQKEPDSKKNPPRERNYKVSFPLASKVLVRGDDMAPIYQWLTEKKFNKLNDNEVQWDFQKYLINEQGALVKVFEPRVSAGNPEILAAVDK